jgi:hypothetical protein
MLGMNNALNLFVLWCQNRKDFIDKSHHVKNMSEVRLQSLCDYFGFAVSYQFIWTCFRQGFARWDAVGSTLLVSVR